MELTPAQKIKINSLLLTGKTEEAIEFLQQAFSIPRHEAVKILEESRNPQPGPAHPGQQEAVKKNNIFIVIIAFTGAVLLGFAIYIVADDYTFSQQALHVPGEVIEYYELESYSEEDGITRTFGPVFRYYLDGKTYTCRGKTTDSPRHKLGEKINILVDQANPDHVLPDTFRDRWFIPLVLTLSGFALSGFAWLMIRYGK